MPVASQPDRDKSRPAKAVTSYRTPKSAVRLTDFIRILTFAPTDESVGYDRGPRAGWLSFVRCAD
jgi:hypothetical protein